jgi:hypothetical protein
MPDRQPTIIVSASRRQDMPACATGALLGQIAAREFVWRHPFSGKSMRLSFVPEQIGCLALWSKDFGALLETAARRLIDPLRPVFLFTVNDCPELEPGLRSSLEERLRQAELIATRYGPARLRWRFDPIVHFVDASGRSRDNLGSFAHIARRMAGLGIDRAVVSFAQLYGKVRRRQERHGIALVDPPLDDKRAILSDLAGEAAALGITLETCCQPELEGCHPNVQRASCIDGRRLRGLLEPGQPDPDLSAHPSRKGCGCTRSIDVGSYAPCPHRCVYCYANPGTG